MSVAVRNLACRLIERYQSRGGGTHYFATDCNFSPRCSEYAKQAIQHHGLIRGLPVALNRLRRCMHPDLVEKIRDPFIPQDAANDV